MSNSRAHSTRYARAAHLGAAAAVLGSGQLLGQAAAGDGGGLQLGLHHSQGGGGGAASQLCQLHSEAVHLLLQHHRVRLHHLVARRLRVRPALVRCL